MTSRAQRRAIAAAATRAPAGVRVVHADGATGTVIGTTTAYTGHTVPQIRWDDRSSTRFGAVTLINEKEATRG